MSCSATLHDPFADNTFQAEDVAVFHQTRKKFDTDRAQILPDIYFDLLHADTIVDVGCGTGRLYYLLKDVSKNFAYIGIDHSANMLNYAKEHIPTQHTQLLQADMVEGLGRLPYGSADCVIAMKSFHHLRTTAQRRNFIKQAYRVLQYKGILVMVNRNLWQKKYVEHLRASIRKACIRMGFHDRRDITIPRTTKEQKIHYRHYHLCGRRELATLCKNAGFVVTQQYFTAKEGKTTKRRAARNLVTIARKTTIFS